MKFIAFLSAALLLLYAVWPFCHPSLWGSIRRFWTDLPGVYPVCTSFISLLVSFAHYSSYSICCDN